MPVATEPITASTLTLSVIVPCFNEEKTLAACAERLLAIEDGSLSLEVIVVDDGSCDGSPEIARELAAAHPQVRALYHERNQGKGASLRTGFRAATGDFVAVQDADLEYDPRDLKALLGPLLAGDADVVLGSRFVGAAPHRVLYFWHYVGNALLTLLSNMFTDLNLTDMETGYKVFRREVLRGIDIEEDRFGFEPEIVAKIAHRGLRIYEMGVSYRGRTYEEGKKIGFRDGFRALYCIVRYNARRAPAALQLALYAAIGTVAAVVNFLLFLALWAAGTGVTVGSAAACGAALGLRGVIGAALCGFRGGTAWRTAASAAVLCAAAGMDVAVTRALTIEGAAPWLAKAAAVLVGFLCSLPGVLFWGSWREK